MRISLSLAAFLLVGCFVGQARAAEAMSVEADRDVAISLLSEAERSARANQLAARGGELLDAGRYAEARRILRDALKYDPVHVRARELLEKTEQYLAAYGEIPGAAVEGAIRRERISVEQRLIEARYRLRTAETALEEALRPVTGDLSGRAAALEERHRALLRAAEAAERAGLQFAGLPARIDTTSEREALRELNRRIRDRRADLVDAIDEVQRQIALQKVEEARARVEETSEQRRAYQMEKARSFLDGRRYEEAEEIVRQVLVEAPADEEARELLRRIQEEAIRYHMEQNEELTAEERRRVNQRTKRAATPEITLENRIVYPEDWEEMERRREAEAATAETARDRQVREALSQRISVEFAQAEIEDVLEQLRAMTNVGFVYKEPSIAFPAPVTLTLRDARLESVLDWSVRKAGLQWTVREGMVFVTGAEDITDSAYNKAYYVLDLATRIRNAPDMPDGQGLNDDIDEGEDLNLGEMVGTIIAQDLLEEQVSVRLDDRGVLTVFGTKETHDQVEDLLRQLRAATSIQVAVNARLMRVADDFWTHFLSDFEPQNFSAPPELLFTQEGQFGWYNAVAAPGGEFNAIRVDWDEGQQPALVPPSWFGGIFIPPGDSFGQNRMLSSAYAVNAIKTIDTDTDHADIPILGTFLPMVGASTFGGQGDLTEAGLSTLISQYGFLQAIHADWFIQAAKESGKADQLFAPHIVVYNNRSGYAYFSTARGILEGYDISDGLLDPDVEFIDEERGLEVRPIVSADRKYITLQINPRVTQVLNITEVEIFYRYIVDGGDFQFTLPLDLANTIEWEVATTATIPDGGSVILSGMSVSVENRARNGIPIVQDLPIVGNAFSRRANQTRTDDLMVLVSARMILLEEEEARLTR